MGILSNEGAVRTEEIEILVVPGIKVLAKESGNWQDDQAASIRELVNSLWG